MGEFWYMMAPFLIAAVVLPGWIMLGVWFIPADEWVEAVIQDWADSQDLRVVGIDDAQWFDRLLERIYKVDRVRIANTRAYRRLRVQVVDRKGSKRECKAVVGRFLLWPAYRNISVTWIKARGIEE